MGEDEGPTRLFISLGIREPVIPWPRHEPPGKSVRSKAIAAALIRFGREPHARWFGRRNPLDDDR
jgi:hypothetical protein